MNAFEDLQRGLLTSWAASPTISEVLYFGRASKDASLPYAVFFLDSSNFYTNSGFMFEFEVEFNLFSDAVSSEEINDLVEAVRNKFNRKIVTLSGGHTMVDCMLIDTEKIIPNDDGHWEATMFFDCRVK